jgi:ubiquinone/menaquinone biosynthesis C-methylase UbiE
MKFKDHFSGHAVEYAKFRPHYPDELFEYLASISPRHELAWDCATGNGQAAVGLARHFDSVIATDASAQQIASAELNDRISYRVAPAEASGIDSASVDLTLVAQALHWFDIDRFFTEAKRVLKENGVLAISSYRSCRLTRKWTRLFANFIAKRLGPSGRPSAIWLKLTTRTSSFHLRNYRRLALRCVSDGISISSPAICEHGQPRKSLSSPGASIRSTQSRRN